MVVIATAIVLLFFNIFMHMTVMLIEEKKMTLILVFLGAIIIYVIKATRMYLIMLEKRLTFKRFIKVYVMTSLVNLAFPFKLGEIFRVYSYGNQMENYKQGFLCVIVDRYFDAVPLFILLFGFTMATSGTLLSVVVVLFLFLILITVAYYIFPSTYQYMNQFIIIGTNSSKGIWALTMLDKANGWYQYVTELVKGRGIILLVLSIITWLMEYAILILLAKGLQDTFKMEDFVNYMNSVFIGIKNLYVMLYVGISAALFLVSILIMCGVSLRKGRI